MYYIQCSFPLKDDDVGQILIANLAEVGFESFEETEETLLAYIAEEQFREEEVRQIAEQYKTSYSIKRIEQQNWNAAWEQSFEPVRVDDFCVIRADFHTPATGTQYEIIVTPKMSFGTGHHATTQLMIEQMRDMDVKGRSVLDFGSGTGVLAILAHKMGATAVKAIDNDRWAYENAIENIERNSADAVTTGIGSLEMVQGEQYDIILANINRHILLAYMDAMYAKLNEKGALLLSGILLEDEDVIADSATAAGFKLKVKKTKGNWSSILFIK